MRLYLLVFAVVSEMTLASSCTESAHDASRVAVAGGSITEVIYFLGEEERLIAVDSTSNFPDAALELPKIGYVRALSTEGLLSLKPTLVLGEADMGPPEVLAQLDSAGVDMLTVPDQFTAVGIQKKIRCVAGVLGLDSEQLDEAENRLSPYYSSLKKVEVTERSPSALLILVFQEGAAIAAGAGTSGAGLLKMAGLRNALAGVSGWKPLSAESLILANPDYLIVTDRAVRAAGGVEKILDSPGVRITEAGRHKRIIEMDGMSMLGFGPRTLESALGLSGLSTRHAN